MSRTVLEIRGAGMTFSGTRVLTDVDLTLHEGEVHAVVGHNGSGKSTLVTILAGHLQPDPGTRIVIDGDVLPLGDCIASLRHGLRFVHQNLALVATLSVTENLALGVGYGAQPLGRIDWSHEHKRAQEQMWNLGYELDPRVPVGDLPPSAQTAVAIARALSHRPAQPPRVLVLDEATATMPDAEVQRFLALLHHLTDHGLAVLYVTHHLEEIHQVAHRVTVLRDGRAIAQSTVDSLSVAEIAELIVGRADWRAQLNDPPHVDIAATQTQGRLSVRGLSGATIDDVSFEASPGQILGIAGITGSGREELAELLVGARPRSGTVHLGESVLQPGRPDASVRAGMVLVPASRATKAVLPALPVRHNMTVSRTRDFWRRGVLHRGRERTAVREWIDRLKIGGANPDGGMTSLSGGNQQKVILARALRLAPRLLLLDEPTQGVDVGAVADIHAMIRSAGRDSIVIICSSDTSELAALADHVLILRRGRVAGWLQGAEITEENIDRMQLAGSGVSR